MFLLRILVGFLLVAIGFGYLFYPSAIVKMNAIMRDKVFRDAYVLLDGKRLGTVLLSIGFLLLLMTLRYSR